MIFSLSLNQDTSVAGPPVDVHVIIWVILSYLTDMLTMYPTSSCVDNNNIYICVSIQAINVGVYLHFQGKCQHRGSE